MYGLTDETLNTGLVFFAIAAGCAVILVVFFKDKIHR